MGKHMEDRMAKNEIPMERIIKEAEQETELFCSTTGKAYIKVSRGNAATQLILVDSEAFEEWFRAHCYERYGKILTPGGHIQAQAHMRMRAKQKKERSRFYKRVYEKPGAVYYDLGREDGKYLKITADEIKLVRNPHILFHHSDIFAPQVEPETGKVSPKDVKRFIKAHFNFKSEADRILFAVFLVGCFFGERFSNPVLEIYGQKASAKSTCFKRIQDLIDPLTVNPLFPMSRKEHEVAMCLTEEYMVCFDNISYISQDISDLLCRNYTRTVQVKRKLFTDSTQAISEPNAIVCINSTRQCILRSDLADRAIFLELERIRPEKMLGDDELRKNWEKDRPFFFGALCQTVKGVLGDTEPARHPSPVRMVDFYEMAVKAGKQIGYAEEQVYEAFRLNRKKINESVVSGNVLLMVIENFMEREENRDGIKSRVSDFYRDLKIYALEECGINGRNFPGAPEVMTRKMSEDRSNLEDAGIYYEIKKGKNARYIEIWRQ